MNAERLHAIVKALRAEIEGAGYPGHLEELAAGLQALTESPNQPEPQQRVSSAREALNEVLQNASSNNFPQVWQQTLDELGVADLVGDALLEKIESILLVNDITPNTAADEVGQIRDRVMAMVTALNQTAGAFEFFEIPSEDLEPGEFEVGIMIPRKAVNEGLESLGKEFVEIKQIIATFSELAGENRPEVKVRAISSSEFQVFLDSAPAVAAMIATTLERLMTAYEKFLTIRKLHREMSEQGIPDEKLEGVSGFVSESMKDEIRKIVEEALAESGVTDEGRRNELRTDLTIKISNLAERIDAGYDVEVRAGPLPESVEGEEDGQPLDPDTRKAAETVLDANKSLEFLNVEGKSILHLEAPSNASDEVPGESPE